MPNPSEEIPASSNAPNEDLKDFDVLCTLKIKIESQNSHHGCIKDQWPYPNLQCIKTRDHIQIKIKIQYPSQEPPASSKAPNEDLKDMDVLCTFKIKTESQNLDHGCIKDQWPYSNQDQGAKPQSRTYNVFQCPKLGLEGLECSLQLQNRDGEQKVGTWVYQRWVTIYK